MRKSLSFIACAALFAAPVLFSSPAQAKIGDDDFIILTQGGVPGAPVGGSTGDAGNAGVGDHAAGTDRANTYDTNNSGTARSTTSSMKDTTSSLDSTTSGEARHHHSHSGTNGAGNGTPTGSSTY